MCGPFSIASKPSPKQWATRKDDEIQTTSLLLVHPSVTSWPGQNSIFLIEFCAKQQIKIDNLDEKRATAHISIKQYSYFRWWCKKAWKLCLSWFWINSNKSLQPISCKWNAMFESHLDTCIDWTSFYFPFEDFLSNLLLKMIVLLGHNTGQPSITSALHFQFSFFWGHWAAQWELSKKRCNEEKFQPTVPIYVQCNKMYWWKDYLKIANKNSGISCLALICNSSNLRMTEKNWFKVAKYDDEYTLLSSKWIWNHG